MKWMAYVAGAATSLAMLAACGNGAREPAQHDGAAVEVPDAPSAPSQPAGTAALHQRATQALAEQRMVSPRGDNAVEYYLAARAQDGQDGRAQAALVELQPYLLIAVEQALARGDVPEADRLLGLLSRADPQAPALPRLRTTLAGSRRDLAERARREETLAPALAATPALPASPVDAQASVVAASPSPAASDVPFDPPSVVPTPHAVAEDANDVANAAVQTEGPPRTTTPAASVPAARVAAVRPPRLLQDAAPRYPLPALRAGTEGQAEVAFTIQPDGSVRNVQVVSSTPSGVFDASAVAVAQRWRFEATGQAHALRRTVLYRLPARPADGG
ncbi:energy transducer TonB [Pseudoxanthomonas putridarboris]|uniref:Protein TonB n=1 Tax=Pseudoxanthomonas putridarboris TaxID=752605 RepID=A0ABU9IXT1_9GAMM